MSARSKAKRPAQRKPPAATKAAGRPSTLERVEQAQKRLDKNADLFRQAQESRRQEVQRAFQSGVSVQDLTSVLGVSKQKVYELLGGVRGSKTSPSSRTAG